ncbi:putative porin [Methyloversatilis sp.]|uniref:putative porin n=1 Tax=Methyloversatilis sp. TaxID=2569862 RepID=UPI0027376F53|nr:putative porin [Methyloversatilis sp.]MDP2868738.1 putative porin [Methyloversatilis sp.]MDP3455350.1 putative porin [Methyloversatilis sp.]MDP3579183.1 putative porin [Methyloversatilis sp.]
MKKSLLPVALAALFALPAHASEAETLDTLRQTTLNLIDALVDTGVLTREKADALVKAAEVKTAKAVAKAKKDTTVRVQYVPESVKAEIRDQLKQEVLAQARSEGWATPNAIPEWTERIKIEGDIRVRYQNDSFPNDNTPISALAPGAAGNAAATSSDFPLGSRFPSGVDLDGNGFPNGNVSDDVNRLRLRARLGVLAKINDSVSAGLRFTTGNVTDRVSTNQTLGSGFNKYSFLVDRAYIKIDPVEWASFTGGRVPNPWFATDLVWDEDLNFDGVAVNLRNVTPTATLRPFATAGWFPLRADSPPNAEKQWLAGAQIGTEFDFNSSVKLRFGVAKYHYSRIEARTDTAYDAFNQQPLQGYGRYEQSSALRQKGNTLVRTNSPLDGTEAPIYGLASKFEPWVLTATADLAYFDPVHVLLSAEYVKNTGFDRGDILRRTGLNVSDGSDTAWHLRAAVGMPSVRLAHDWQVFASYKHIGSDSVLDGFTDSDFGLGGTNLKGFVLGGSYGVYRDTALGFRWYSAETIDGLTFDPFLIRNQRFQVDTMMVDMNVRF